MARQRSAEDKGKERRKEKVKGRRKRLRDRSKENQGKDEKVFVRQAKVGVIFLMFYFTNKDLKDLYNLIFFPNTIFKS